MNDTTVQNLIEKIENPDVPLEALRDYVTVDPARSKPFTPAVVVDVRKLGAAGTEVLYPTSGSISDAFTRRRQKEYRRKIAAGWSGLKFVSEGDSWFQYPIVLRDVIDWLNDQYAILDFAAAGDTLSNMKRGILRISETIHDEKSHGFLISGGGNDLLEGGSLRLLLRPYKASYNSAIEYVIVDRLDDRLAGVLRDYKDFFDVLTRTFPKLVVVCHGYDWMIPRFDGIYLWPVTEEREIPEPLRQEVFKIIVDAFNERLKALAHDPSYGGRVLFVDCRGLVGGKANWFDEIHPRDPGYGRVATRIRDTIAGAVGV